jgi:PAS domain S-box-containing protein
MREIRQSGSEGGGGNLPLPQSAGWQPALRRVRYDLPIDDPVQDPALLGRRLLDEARDGVALVEAIIHTLVLNTPQTSNSLHRDPRVAALIRQLGEQMEDHNRALLDFLPAPAFIQLDGTFASVNPLHVKLLGARSRNHFIGEPVLHFIHASSRETFKELTRQVEREMRPVGGSSQTWISIAGEEVHVELLASPIVYRGRPAIRAILLRPGSADHLDHISRWIGDFLADRWLRYRRAGAIEALAASASLAICRVDAAGICTFANDTAVRLLGTNLEGKPFTAVDIPASAWSAVTPDAGGGSLFVFSDRGDAEQQQSDRMDAVSRLAAGLVAADDPVTLLRELNQVPQSRTIELSHWLRGSVFWIREDLDPSLDLETSIPSPRVFVNADAKLLARAFSHVARFATRRHGQMRLTMSIANDFARIAFTIGGGPLEPSRLDHLFDEDPLGLGVVHLIMRRHNGRALASNTEDGVELELILPTIVPDVVEELLFHRLSTSGPLKVLIVEDDSLVPSSVGDRQAYAGLEMGITSRVADLGDMIKDFHPDLVLIDAQQIAVEGVEAIREVAARWSEVAIVCCGAGEDIVAAPNVVCVPYDIVTLLRSAERIATRE